MARPAPEIDEVKRAHGYFMLCELEGVRQLGVPISRRRKRGFSIFAGSLPVGIAVIQGQLAGLKRHSTPLCPALAPPHAAHQHKTRSGRNEEAERRDQIKREHPRLDAARSIPCNRRGAPESA